ncbi:MAG TPA: Y-family DNA polymerase [Candidatus Saccharimonadales bacterium]|nr:Y-family DNA polymerase [Candidatus Saccharimonadales bacterium]
MSNQKVLALIDANNFFVSCERLFRPELATRPVIVRSSNDGCVVARSNEAKALGIPMGAPVFKIRHLLKAHNITEFSGSFDLYGDISYRLTELLRALCPRIEAYSVDESFLDLSELGIVDYEAWGRVVRAHIWRAIGIPVSIGIAPTKTLAKLASELAKKQLEGSGVKSFIGQPEGQLSEALARIPVQDLWGVGWRLAPRLKAEGLLTAADIQTLPPKRAQQLMGVHGRQLVAELNGTSCMPLEAAGRPHQSLSRTRMFGADTSELGVLEAALATLGTTACVRLRSEGLLVRRAGFFLTTNKHLAGYRRWYTEVTLSTPSADTGHIIAELQQQLVTLFNPAQRYHRAGVLLQDLVPDHRLQTDLLGYVDISQHQSSKNRMQAIDQLNARYGKNKLHYAAEDLSQAWRPRQGLRSPRYTTHWNELPEAAIALGK